MRNIDTMWDFPVMDGVSFPNANRVHKKLEYFPDLDCETDIISNLPSENKLYQEITATGLLLFER